jgi:hypothetical protein
MKYRLVVKEKGNIIVYVLCAQLSNNLDHIKINLTFLKFRIFIQRSKENVIQKFLYDQCNCVRSVGMEICASRK